MPPQPSEPAEETVTADVIAALDRAEQAHARGAHLEAATEYAAAYQGMDDATKDHGGGAAVVGFASESYRQAYEQSHDLEALLAARRVLESLEAHREQRGVAIPASVAEESAQVEAAIAGHVPVAAPPPAPDAPTLEERMNGRSRAAHRRALALRAKYDALSDADKDSGKGASFIIQAVDQHCLAHHEDQILDHVVAARALLGGYSVRRHGVAERAPRMVEAKLAQVSRSIATGSSCVDDPPLPELPTRPGCVTDGQCAHGHKCVETLCVDDPYTNGQRPLRTGGIMMLSGAAGFWIGFGVLVAGARATNGGLAWTGATLGVVSVLTFLAGIPVAIVGGAQHRRHKRRHNALVQLPRLGRAGPSATAGARLPR